MPNARLIISPPPTLEPRDRAGGEPGEDAVHAGFFHLFDAEDLHFLRRIDFRRGQECAVGVTHGTIFRAERTVFFRSAAFLVFFHGKTAALAESVGGHKVCADL